MAGKIIKIITVDDHQIFRQGLTMILNRLNNVEVIAQAADGKEFLDILKSGINPDIVFMDIRMPLMNGIEATKAALKIHPKLKIIAISMFGEEENLENMIKAGAKGFLLKNINRDEIEHAIRQVISNSNYYSTELLPYFTKKYLNPAEQGKTLSGLTKRELDVLKLIAHGYTNKEIAEKLFISKRTVDGHRANIFDKTDSKNVVELLIFAIKNKLIKI